MFSLPSRGPFSSVPEDQTMMSWGQAERKANKYLKDIDVDDIQDQIDSLRDYLKDLTHAFRKNANRQIDRARGGALDLAQDAEEAMKDNLAASLVLALGLGVLVGYFIRRGSE